MLLCRRCLLRDIDRDGYFSSIFAYINSIPPAQKAEDAVYRQRLELCKQCDHLVNGMCDLCGCFVEVRAVKRGAHCPLREDIW